MALYLFLFINLLLIPTISCSIKSPGSLAPPKCLLFNFGDSNSDTGGFCAAFGIIPQDLPGRVPSCRASNGRLYLDFLCERLGITPLNPYMESISSKFRNGANFAISGMPAQSMANHCFPLLTQANQFAYFQHKLRERKPKGKGDELRNAIFSFDIGQYDLANSLGLSHKEIVDEKIPPALASIKNAIKLLYELGARKFVIYNTGPLGCLPSILGSLRKGDHHLQLDKAGCSADCNELARTFNDGLSSSLAAIRSQLEEAMIVYVDMYTIKYDLISSPSKYGLQNPLTPCLSQEGSAPTICLDPSRAVNWDGIHYTEAANSIIASKIWFGDYASPYMKFKDLCEMAIKD